MAARRSVLDPLDASTPRKLCDLAWFGISWFCLYSVRHSILAPPEGPKDRHYIPDLLCFGLERTVLLLCYSTSFLSASPQHSTLHRRPTWSQHPHTTGQGLPDQILFFPSWQLLFFCSSFLLCFHGGQFVLDIAKFFFWNGFDGYRKSSLGVWVMACDLGQQYSTTFFVSTTGEQDGWI